MMRLWPLWIGILAVLALAMTLSLVRATRSPASIDETFCQADGSPTTDLVLCDDFTGAVAARWSIGSRGRSWPESQFVSCRENFGFGDECAAWSNYLLFDNAWGFYGYDARRRFTPQSRFYVRWYQYVSDPYAWGSLEDKSVMLHDHAETIVAYVGTSRNHLPVEPNSGPGVPFVANYQDVDWPETGGQFTNVNRFQNQRANLELKPGRWYLFEWYLQLNTPGRADGVTRLWIDETSRPISRQTLRMEYTDMRWLRSEDADKQFGVVRLTVYHQRCDGVPNTCPPNGPEMLTQSHRWDELVISKAPVGPLDHTRR